MKVFFYSVKNFEIPYLEAANKNQFEIAFTGEALTASTCRLANGFAAISITSMDDASAEVLSLLEKMAVEFISIRAAGYDNIDIEAANAARITVANVPEYSPHAIAEHTMAMILALNRKLITAHQQVYRHNFSVDNLIGFDLNKKIAGVVGTGHVGSIMAKIFHGFGCTVLANDLQVNQQLVQKYDVHYVGIHTLCTLADIITLHVPLTSDTHHLINRMLIQEMKKKVMIINTSRGAVVNIDEIITALEKEEIGYYGMDVYEKGNGVFYHDHSRHPVTDPALIKLMSFPNVLITPHQAFATKEALTNIAETTFHNITCKATHMLLENELTYSPHFRSTA